MHWENARACHLTLSGYIIQLTEVHANKQKIAFYKPKYRMSSGRHFKTNSSPKKKQTNQTKKQK